MIFIFPLAPILAAIAILILCVGTGIASVANYITTACWVVFAILSIVLIIYTIARKSSGKAKAIGLMLAIPAIGISLIESKSYFSGVLASADAGGISGTLEFLFVLVFGGLIWFACIFACAFAGYKAANVDEYDDVGWNSFEAIASMVGSLLLGGLFGLV